MSKRQLPPPCTYGLLTLSTVAILLVGCATTPKATGDGSAAAATEPLSGQAIAEDLIRAFETEDYARVVGHLDPEKAPLTVEKVQEVWEDLVGRLGPLSKWEHTGEVADDAHESHQLHLDFASGALEALVTVDTGSRKVIGLFFRPGATKGASAPYVKPETFTSREVRIGEGDLALSGTLTVPNGAGPFPGVILLHGSGPLDRDSTIAANKPFQDLAEGLSTLGIVVLRFDKRTFQHPGSLPAEVTLENEVILDGVQALEVLGQQPEVDPARRYVLGHSLGAFLAPEVAKRGGPVAGVVLLAPPGRAPWDLILDQFRYLELPEAQLEQLEADAQRLEDGTLPDDTPFLGAPASYWRDWAKHEAIPTARALGVPLLVLRGARDYQVTEADLAAWEKGLGGRVGVDIETLPSLNHLFIAGEGRSAPAEYATPGHVDAGVVTRIAKFFGSSDAP